MIIIFRPGQEIDNAAQQTEKQTYVGACIWTVGGQLVKVLEVFTL